MQAYGESYDDANCFWYADPASRPHNGLLPSPRLHLTDVDIPEGEWDASYGSIPVVPIPDCLVYVFVIDRYQTTPIAMHTHSPDLSSQALVAHTQLLLDSFERVVGRSLMPRTGNPQEEVGVLDLCISNQSLLHDTNVGHGWRVFFFFGCALKASRMFNLPDRVVLSHGTQEDPVLNYANALGLKLWEMDWERLTSTPSRKYVSTSAS